MIFKEILEMQTARQANVREIQMIVPPHPSSGKKGYTAYLNKLAILFDQHKEKCFGIERHVDLLLATLKTAAKGDMNLVADWVEQANATNPIDPWFAAQIAELKDERDKKAGRKPKDASPGQKTVFDELKSKEKLS